MRWPRVRSPRQRAEFWNFGGALVYVLLVGVGCLLTFVFVPADMELLGVLAAMVLPIPFVLGMMAFRGRQYMRAMDADFEDA